MRKLFQKISYLTLKTNAQFSEISRFQNNFLATSNLAYIETLYENWLADKKSVTPSFAAYFELLEKGVDPEEAFQKPSS